MICIIKNFVFDFLYNICVSFLYFIFKNDNDVNLIDDYYIYKYYVD